VGERWWLEVGRKGGGLEIVGWDLWEWGMGYLIWGDLWRCGVRGGDVREARESLFSCLFGGGGEVMLGFLWVRSLKNLPDKGAVLDK